MARAMNKKYLVGSMSRKDFMAAIEHGMEEKPGSVIIRINSHRGKKYEIRVRRKINSIELAWALPGTYFDSATGYDNE